MQGYVFWLLHVKCGGGPTGNSNAPIDGFGHFAVAKHLCLVEFEDGPVIAGIGVGGVGANAVIDDTGGVESGAFDHAGAEGDLGGVIGGDVFGNHGLFGLLVHEAMGVSEDNI